LTQSSNAIVRYLEQASNSDSVKTSDEQERPISDESERQMLTPVPPSECIQAREAASLCLDGGLSELEAARLDLHLRGCAACRAYSREIGAIAIELRSAPLERPRVEIFAPRRRSGLRIHAAAVAAVGLVVAAAGSSFAIGRVVGTHGGTTTVTATGAADDAAGARADSQQQHILAMLRGTAEPDRPSSGKVIPL
jgi:anti-sigma factor RsiW